MRKLKILIPLMFAFSFFMFGQSNKKELKKKKKYESILQKDSTNLDARINLGKLLFDNSYLLNPIESKSQFEKILKLDSTNAIAQNYYATILWIIYNKNDEAKKYYEKAIKQDSVNAQLFMRYANLLSNKFNDKNKAKLYLEKSLKLDSNSIKTYLSYGYLLWDLKDKQNAKKVFEKALKIDSNDVLPLSYYAYFLYYGLSDSVASFRYIKKGLKINPNDYFLYKVKDNIRNGNTLKTEDSPYSKFITYDKMKSGKTLYEKQLKTDSNNLSITSNYLTFLKRKKDEKMLAKRIFDSLPKNYKTYNDYADYVYYCLFDTVKALKLHKRALSYASQDVWAISLYADYLSDVMNNPKKAQQYYEKAFCIESEQPTIHYKYACFLKAKMKNEIESKRHYLIAVRLDENLRTDERNEYFGIYK